MNKMTEPGIGTDNVGKNRRLMGKRGKGRIGPKGRQVKTLALEDVRMLLLDRMRRPDLLLEYLHLLQDHYGCLSLDHLAALAEELRLSQAEVYEVATFYAHFDVVENVGTIHPACTVRVCDSVTCAMFGGEDLRKSLASKNSEKVRVVRAPCMGRCESAPVAQIGQRHVDNATVLSIEQVITGGVSAPRIPVYLAFSDYQREGGYGLLRECLSGVRLAETVITEMEESSLKGLGGAGFSAGRKWRLVHNSVEPLVAVNADEGEPGTFKDRYVLETNPHQFLEGMLVAAWAVGATTIFIYVRDEYPAARKILEKELEVLGGSGLLEGFKVHIRRGAGAYICGEESAMLESLEGKRGEPRHKPPFPAEAGLFGRPTLIHNVETLYWVPEILTKGADWFARQGRRGSQGLRLFSVSGRINVPGVKVASAGITALELVEEYSGGMQNGHQFKAYLPGGASGGILPANLASIPLDFGTLDEYGCFVGSGAVVILSDQDPIAEVVLNLMRFFEDESCGQCTPCRVGCEKAVKLLEQPVWDEELLRQLSVVMTDASICGLGQAAPNPLLGALQFFREELPL
ncbi:MAG: NADH-quinone oxidoreductase subunit F [Alphaproteobacteria bacterium MarineAlpha9_Bin7]|nr:MAG: NADH-quinone oxidoreductase subunit F [Alphaproteobacteria bacterium MarineAlpha9_Bin7]